MIASTRTAAIAALICIALALCGCSQNQLVQKIVNFVPTAIGFVDAAAASVSSLAAGQVISADETAKLNAGFAKAKTGLQTIATTGNTYLASPTASGFASVVSAVDAIVGNFDSFLKDVAQVKNDGARAKVVVVAGVVDAAIHFIDGVISSAKAGQLQMKTASLPAHVDLAALAEMQRLAD